MKSTKGILIRMTLAVAAICTIAMSLTLTAQDWMFNEKGEQVRVDNLQNVARLEDMKSLDDIRRLNLGPMFTRIWTLQGVNANPAGGEDMVMLSNQNPDASAMVSSGNRNPIVGKIREFQKALTKPGANRPEIEAKLKAALTEYFVSDMMLRVRELDAIKAEVAETEAVLQKRLENQEEMIRLQMLITIREANGLGFYPTQDASSAFGSAATKPNTNSLTMMSAPTVAVVRTGPVLSPGDIFSRFDTNKNQTLEADEIGRQNAKSLIDRLASFDRKIREVMDSKGSLTRDQFLDAVKRVETREPGMTSSGDSALPTSSAGTLQLQEFSEGYPSNASGVVLTPTEEGGVLNVIVRPNSSVPVSSQLSDPTTETKASSSAEERK